MKIKWGHFSDLHFQFNNYDTSTLRRKLLDCLENVGELDYLFITGDILHKGNQDSEITRETTQYIHSIADTVNCNYSNIFISPGNHDLIRSKARKNVLDIIIKDYQKTEDLDTEAYSSIIIDNVCIPFQKICVDIRNNEDSVYPHVFFELEHLNIIILNTSIFAGQTYPEESNPNKDLDNKNLYICDKYFTSLIKEAKKHNKDKKLNILLAHHGTECFVEKQCDNLRNALNEMGVDLYLCGHIHSSNAALIQNTHDIWQYSCGGIFANRSNSPSFIIGSFDTESKEITLQNYQFLNISEWRPSNDLKPPYGVNGISHWIPKRLDELYNKETSLTLSRASVKHKSDFQEKKSLLSKVHLTFTLGATPFEDENEKWKYRYSGLETKHLILLDKYYALAELSYSKVLACTELLSESTTDLIENWVEFIEEQSGVELGNCQSLESFLSSIIEKYPFLFGSLCDKQLNSHSLNFDRIISMKEALLCSLANKFYGYVDELNILKEKLLNESGYVFITGEQHFGKTLLLTKAVAEVIEKDDLQHRAPWLKKMLLVLGVKAGNRSTCMRLLTEQANLILPKPLNPDPCEYNETVFFEILVSRLSRVLDRVVIVLDALDVMGMEDLDCFPTNLPDNCLIVFSSYKIRNENLDKIRPYKIKLSGFEEEHVYEMFDLDKRTSSQKEKSFIKFVMNRTKKNPFHITALYDEIQKKGGIIPDKNRFQDVYKGLDRIYIDYKEKWGMTSGDLFQTLKLLSIFERVDYLSLAEIQAYLKTKNIALESYVIEEMLQQVEPQLDVNYGSDYKGYKLKDTTFATFLRASYTNIDWELILSDIKNWLEKERNDLKLKFFIDLYIESSEHIRQLIYPIFNQYIKLRDFNSLTFIVSIFSSVACRFKDAVEVIRPILARAFYVLEENEKPDVEVIIAHYNFLYYADASYDAQAEANLYLKQAANRGYEPAIWKYAEFLESGDLYSEQNPEEAINQYEKLIDDEEALERIIMISTNFIHDSNFWIRKIKDALAKLQVINAKKYLKQYAFLLAYGFDNYCNVQEANRIFDELIMEDFEDAALSKMILITYGILEPIGITYEHIPELMNHINKSDQMRAYYQIGYRLDEKLDNDSPIKKIAREYLKTAADSGYLPAKGYIFSKEINRSHQISQREKELLLRYARSGSKHALNCLLECIIKKKIEVKDSERILQSHDKNVGEIKHTIAHEKYRNRDYQGAFEHFEASQILGIDSSNNLAYLLRRSLAKSEKANLTETLFGTSIEIDGFVVVNQSLFLLSKDESEEGWQKVLSHLKSHNVDFSGPISFWETLDDDGLPDGEGTLVLALFQTIGVLPQIYKGKTACHRFEAVVNEYNIPDVLLSPEKDLKDLMVI